MVEENNCLLCGDWIRDSDDTVRVSSFSLSSKLCLLSKFLNADAQFQEESTWDVGECIDNDAFCSPCSITVEAFIELHDVLQKLQERIECKKSVILRKLRDLDSSSFGNNVGYDKKKLIRLWTQFQLELLRTQTGASKIPTSRLATESGRNKRSRIPGPRSRTSLAKTANVHKIRDADVKLRECFVTLERMDLGKQKTSNENDRVLSTESSRESAGMRNKRLKSNSDEGNDHHEIENTGPYDGSDDSDSCDPQFRIIVHPPMIRKRRKPLQKTQKQTKIPSTSASTFNCFFCEGRFSTKRARGNHISKEHPEKGNVRPCIVCSKLVSNTSMFTHMWSHKTKEEKATAIAARRRIPGAKTRNQPLSSSRRKPSTKPQNQPLSSSSSTFKFNCFFCESRFSTKRARGNHISKEHAEKGNFRPCIVCRKLVNNTSMFSHMWSHKSLEEKAAAIAAGERKIKSKVIDSDSGVAVELESGICKICGKPIKSGMSKHLWTHMNPEDKLKYGRPHFYNHRERFGKCNVCGKEFGDIHSHMKSHIPIQLRQNVECTVCGLKLSSQVALRWHTVRKHRPLSEKQQHILRCPYCTRTFYKCNKTLYNRHIKVHLEGKSARSFVCEVCGKAFFSKNDLKKHYDVHNEERIYQCQYCPMAYRHQKNLGRHLRTKHKQ